MQNSAIVVTMGESGRGKFFDVPDGINKPRCVAAKCLQAPLFCPQWKLWIIFTKSRNGLLSNGTIR